MKVLHLIDSLQIGGAEVLLKDVVQELNRANSGIENYVITTYSGGTLTEEVQKIANYNNLNFNSKQAIAKILELRKFIKSNQINVVHTHLYNSTIIGRLSAPKGVKVVTSYHNMEYEPNNELYSKWRVLLDKFTYKKSYHLIFVSQQVKDIVCSEIGLRENYSILPNFSSPRFHYSYKFNPETKLKLIAVGNLKEVKNFKLAIAVLGILNDLDISLDIYGEGAQQEELQAWIDLTKAKVSLKGSSFIDSDLHSNYDAFLITSKNEGFGIALLEALNSGLPSIIPDIPVLCDIAEDAALIFKNDKIDSLTEVIRQLYFNKNILKEKSEKTVKAGLKYSINNYLESLLEIYRR